MKFTSCLVLTLALLQVSAVQITTLGDSESTKKPIHKMTDADIESDVASVLKKFDKDGSGTIDKEEFKKFANSEEGAEKAPAPELEKMFKDIDSDGSGKINQCEGVAYLKKMRKMIKDSMK